MGRRPSECRRVLDKTEGHGGKAVAAFSCRPDAGEEKPSPLEETPPPIVQGARVILHGFPEKLRLNGTKGRIIAFEEFSGRYTIKADEDEESKREAVLRVPAVNVRKYRGSSEVCRL